MIDELAKQRDQKQREAAEAAGLISDATRIDISALADSMTIEDLRDSYVFLIDGVSRLTTALGDLRTPGEGSINAAIRLLKERAMSRQLIAVFAEGSFENILVMRCERSEAAAYANGIRQGATYFSGSCLAFVLDDAGTNAEMVKAEELDEDAVKSATDAAEKIRMEVG